MNLLTIMMAIVILALSAIVLYYMIRFNNLKNLLGFNKNKQGIRHEKLEERILKLINCSAVLEKLDQDLDKLGSMKFIDTVEIPVDTAKPFLKNYRDHRRTGDNTETILFDWPLIIQAMKQTYGVTASDWVNMAYWSDKGFVIYPANYGATGSAGGLNINQSTTIFQLAKKDASTTDPNDWEAILNTTGRIYNFGDLKPPKGTIK